MKFVKNRQTFLLILILLLGFFIRFQGITWDNGFYMHPDERMLVMVAEKINFFDKLNPEFFNYGSLPIYVLKGSAQFIDFFFFSNFSHYTDMFYLGRFISVIIDTIVIVMIFLTSHLIFKSKKISLLASLLYAVAFFPIQNSHFHIVDVYLNLFSILLIYLSLKYLTVPSYKKVLLLALTCAALIATKITALIFIPIIFIVLILKFDKKVAFQPLSKIFLSFLIFNFSLLTFHFLFMPYAYLSYGKFIQDIFLQINMNSDPYIFPYTLQYVDTIPYLYYLENIFKWGLGPIISILATLGFIFILKDAISGKLNNYINRNSLIIILFIFYLIYFIVIGRSAVKFMRYMLPLYPFFSILAGYGIYKINKLKLPIDNKFISKFLTFAIFIGLIIWTYSFLNIYSKPNTRITASEWILNNIPSGSTIAIEHWDDKLPMYKNTNYNYVEMDLYDLSDNEDKWNMINKQLGLVEYIIIASNRLYVPLQRLKDCQKYEVCYPKTAQYYNDLFNEKIGFKKIAEFSSYPTVPLLDYKINDDSADESFTVYDHPKIMIFKKVLDGGGN